jgi:hypothetical protein
MLRPGKMNLRCPKECWEGDYTPGGKKEDLKRNRWIA